MTLKLYGGLLSITLLSMNFCSTTKKKSIYKYFFNFVLFYSISVTIIYKTYYFRIANYNRNCNLKYESESSEHDNTEKY